MKTRLLYGVLVVLISLVTGCGSDEEVTIQIASPSDGTEVTSSDQLTVVITVSDNFVLDEAAIGKDAEDGRGHWHLNIDGTQVIATADTEVTVDLAELELSAGLHEVQAELRNNDHTPLDPPVSDVIELQVSN